MTSFKLIQNAYYATISDVMMYHCPHCGRILDSYITYRFGEPQIVLTCSCGYNTDKLEYTTSANTIPEEKCHVIEDMMKHGDWKHDEF